MVTTRRRLGGLLFGLFYGGSLVNGVDRGIAYVAQITGNQDQSFDQWPWLGLAVFSLSVVLMRLLGSYVGRSRISGGIASGIGSALLVALPGLVSVGSEVRFSTLCVFAVSAFARNLRHFSSHHPAMRSASARKFTLTGIPQNFLHTMVSRRSSPNSKRAGWMSPPEVHAADLLTRFSRAQRKSLAS